MRSLVLALLVVCAACVCAACGDDNVRSAPPDAATRMDATDERCNINRDYEEVTLSGTTPNGDLSAFRYSFTVLEVGFCPVVYRLVFTERPHDCPFTSPEFELFVSHPSPSEQGADPIEGDILPARAVHSTQTSYEAAADIEFHVTHMDHVVESARLAGRFVANTDGWSLDIPVDTVSQDLFICL